MIGQWCLHCLSIREEERRDSDNHKNYLAFRSTALLHEMPKLSHIVMKLNVEFPIL
jgi:hypothetical protein